jgi:hypothetical protein
MLSLLLLFGHSDVCKGRPNQLAMHDTSKCASLTVNAGFNRRIVRRSSAWELGGFVIPGSQKISIVVDCVIGINSTFVLDSEESEVPEIDIRAQLIGPNRLNSFLASWVGIGATELKVEFSGKWSSRIAKGAVVRLQSSPMTRVGIASHPPNTKVLVRTVLDEEPEVSGPIDGPEVVEESGTSSDDSSEGGMFGLPSIVETLIIAIPAAIVGLYAVGCCLVGCCCTDRCVLRRAGKLEED